MTTNDLAHKISYKEQMLRAYEDKLYQESKYRMALKQERERNKRKFRIYRALVIILGLLDLLAIFIASGNFINKNATSDSGAIIAMGIGGVALFVGSVVLAFSGIGTVLCAYKLIHYLRRLNSEMDTRDYIWRTYDEMQEISEKVTEETVLEKTKMTAELEIDRSEQRKAAEQLRLDYEAGEDNQETISMSELFYVKETKLEELPDKNNPLLLSLCASKKDIKIVTIGQDNENFFYELMQEYLPDTEDGKAKHFQKEYGNTFLVVSFKGKNVGICYGWPRAVVDIEDSSFTLKGIAINEKYQAMGIGSMLLKEFEKRVKAYNFDIVGVGSAPGYVEHYYIKNGYVPVCYKYEDNYGDMKVQLISSETDYRNITRRKGGFVVLEKKI